MKHLCYISVIGNEYLTFLRARFTFKKSSGQFVPPPPAPKPDDPSAVHFQKNAVTATNAKTCPASSSRGAGGSVGSSNASSHVGAVKSLQPSWSGAAVNTKGMVGTIAPLQPASSSANNVMASVSLSCSVFWFCIVVCCIYNCGYGKTLFDIYNYGLGKTLLLVVLCLLLYCSFNLCIHYFTSTP